MKSKNTKKNNTKSNTKPDSKTIQGDIWDLSDVLGGNSTEGLIAELKKKVDLFKSFKSKLNNNISNDDFNKILFAKEELKRTTGKLVHYYNLKFFEDGADSETLAKLTMINQLATELSNETMFFTLWFMSIDDTTAKRLMGDKRIIKYAHFLEIIRKLKQYTKSEEIEQIINLKELTGTEALVTLYSMITNGFTFEFQDKTLGLEEIRSLARHPDPKIRQKAYETLLTKFDENGTVLNEIYKSLVMDWYNESIKIRHYKEPISVRNIANDIDDDAVNALLNVVRKNSKLFSDYFVLKHKINKKNGADYELSRFHLYAPFNAKIREEYDYASSKVLVLDTFKEFDQRFYENAKNIFDKKHIHSHPKKHKRGGAFCECSATNVVPYIMLNHTGNLNDVFTMAHELGHGIHYTFAQSQTEFTFETPLPMAETASVFAEMLLSQKMLKESKNAELKIAILMHMLDSQYATIGRQAYFVIFEKLAHEKIKEGMTKEQLDDEYMKLLDEQFSPMKVPELFKHEYNQIPHIHETPFYCYAYAWGNLLVLALYDMYKKEGRGFIEKYVKILSYGAAKSPKDILAEIGINPADEKFWQRGFEIIKEEVEELKRLAK